MAEYAALRMEAKQMLDALLQKHFPQYLDSPNDSMEADGSEPPSLPPPPKTELSITSIEKRSRRFRFLQASTSFL